MAFYTYVIFSLALIRGLPCQRALSIACSTKFFSCALWSAPSHSTAMAPMKATPATKGSNTVVKDMGNSAIAGELAAEPTKILMPTPKNSPKPKLRPTPTWAPWRKAPIDEKTKERQATL